jgi:hypothetical protein
MKKNFGILLLPFLLGFPVFSKAQEEINIDIYHFSERGIHQRMLGGEIYKNNTINTKLATICAKEKTRNPDECSEIAFVEFGHFEIQQKDGTWKAIPTIQVLNSSIKNPKQLKELIITKYNTWTSEPMQPDNELGLIPAIIALPFRALLHLGGLGVNKIHNHLFKPAVFPPAEYAVYTNSPEDIELIKKGYSPNGVYLHESEYNVLKGLIIGNNAQVPARVAADNKAEWDSEYIEKVKFYDEQ